jgi:23S rRNA (guanosine2251-2'-O)-methyltransferase
MSESALIFGWHAVGALVARQPERIVKLIVQKGRDDERATGLLRAAAQSAIRVETRAARDLDQLVSGANHQGIVAELHPSAVLGEGVLDDILDKLAERPNETPFILILDGVQDPHNLGACLRTADAAGVHAVVVPRDRAAGLSATVRKVASGAADIVPLVQVVNLSRTLKWLKERGLWLVGTDDAATGGLHAANLSGPLGVVMGAEGTGMRRLTREHCDLLVSIPMAGIVESLNVSVATGVVLYEAVRQRGAAPVRRT